LPIVAAFQAGEGILVAVVVTDVNRTQGLQVVIDEEQNLIKAFSCIAEHLRDLEAGKTMGKVPEARDGQQVVVAIGKGKGAGQRPESGETVINNVEGLGLVAEVVFASSVRVGLGYGVL
jgi:hypothetical protein